MNMLYVLFLFIYKISRYNRNSRLTRKLKKRKKITIRKKEIKNPIKQGLTDGISILLLKLVHVYHTRIICKLEYGISCCLIL